MTEHDADRNRVVSEILAERKHLPGALLPILHGVQDALGFVPQEAIARIASALNLSRAEVHGVVTFYHHFRTAPPGRHIVQVCRAESCQAMGAERLIGHVRNRLGVDFHQTSADGQFTLEPVYCLGNCACSPAMMIDEQLYGRVTPERFEDAVRTLEEAT